MASCQSFAADFIDIEDSGNNQLTAYTILILFLGYTVSLKTKYACGKMKSNGEKIASVSERILIK